MAKSRHAQMKNLMRSYELSFFRSSQINPLNNDPRRLQENSDFHMVNEDHHALSNLPTHGYQTEFRRVGNVPNGFLPYRED